MKPYALVVLLILCGLAGGEAVLRLFHLVSVKGIERTIFAPDRPWGTYGNAPNATATAAGERYHFDSDGFRRFLPPQSTAEEPILLVGDSVAFSMGVPADRSVGAQLARRRNAPVIDTSVIGYSTEDEERLVRYLIEGGFRGDIVVVMCLNDIDTGSRAAIARFLSGQEPDRNWLQRLNIEMAEQSALYLGLRGLIIDRRKRHYEMDEAMYADPARVAALENSIARIVAVARGQRLLFVVAPYVYQVVNDARADMSERVLTEAFAASGARAIFLREAFQARAREGARLFLWDDPMHPSAAGAELIADAIAAALPAPSK